MGLDARVRGVEIPCRLVDASRVPLSAKFFLIFQTGFNDQKLRSGTRISQFGADKGTIYIDVLLQFAGNSCVQL